MKVFLSYRRADSQATAGRMAQFLDAIPAVEEVFLDVDGISPGENFESRIGQTLAQVSHVFVLIGPQWAGPAGAGSKTRLFDADDMVRREVQLALASQVRLVPLLLDDTRMPRPAELPPELKALASINAFSLRTAHFDEDMDAKRGQLLALEDALEVVTVVNQPTVVTEPAFLPVLGPAEHFVDIGLDFAG